MAKEQELLRLRNSRVLDLSGEKIGKIGEIFLTDRTQEIAFVTVTLGLLRTREVYVPYELVDVSEEGVVVQVPREILEQAPRSNALGHLTFDQEAELRDYFESAMNRQPELSPISPEKPPN